MRGLPDLTQLEIYPDVSVSFCQPHCTSTLIRKENYCPVAPSSSRTASVIVLTLMLSPFLFLAKSQSCQPQRKAIPGTIPMTSPGSVIGLPIPSSPVTSGTLCSVKHSPQPPSSTLSMLLLKGLPTRGLFLTRNHQGRGSLWC